MEHSTSRMNMAGALMFRFLLLVSMITSVVRAEHVTTDVIIIGAGVSGITAGKTLSENGLTDMVILEATNRVGGRVRITEFAGLPVELGANWVEGVNGREVNPVLTLAEEVKLRTFYSDFDNLTLNVYDQTGHLPDQEKASNQTDAANAFAEGLGTTLTKEGADDISVLVALRLFGRVPATPVEMVFDYFTYDGEFAEPPRVTSLKNTQPLPTFANFGPDIYLVADPRGYAAILGPLSGYLKKNENGTIIDPRLKLNKVVNKIKYSADGVVVSTEDGSTYSAKAAILTVSLGVLQSNVIDFVPDLPYWKLEALFEFDMAIYTKIFLKFPKTFWPVGPGTEFFLYADERRGYYPVWQHLNNEYSGSNVVFVTVTDDESRRIEQQPDNQTKAEAMDVLRTMFGADIPEAEAILVPRWWSNKFFKGSFSNWPIGVSLPEFQELQAPIDRLYFAGEHTSRDYNGYVHGAYYSGIDSANLLLECLTKKLCATGSTKAKNNKH